MVLLDWCSWLLSFVLNTRNITFLLILMLVCSLGITAERIHCYLLARLQSRAFIRETADAFRAMDRHEVLFVAHRKRYSHVAIVVASGLECFESASQRLPYSEAVAMATRALDHSRAAVHRGLKDGLPALATIATTAPLVGLLGTVNGILNAFSGSSMARATLMAMICHNLAVALLTTALGLLIAVPAVWAYNYFSAQLEAFAIEAANSSSDLLTYLAVLRQPSRPERL